MVSPIDNDALLPSSSRTTIIPANDFQFFRGSLHLDCLSFRFKISWPVHPGNAWDEDAHRHTIVVGLLPPRCFVSFILLIFVVCAHTLPRRLGSAIVQPPSQSPPTSSSFFDMMDDGVPRACPDRSRPNPHAPHDDVDEDPTTGPTGWGGGARNPERGWIVHAWGGASHLLRLVPAEPPPSKMASVIAIEGPPAILVIARAAMEKGGCPAPAAVIVGERRRSVYDERSSPLPVGLCYVRVRIFRHTVTWVPIAYVRGPYFGPSLDTL